MRLGLALGSGLGLLAMLGGCRGQGSALVVLTVKGEVDLPSIKSVRIAVGNAAKSVERTFTISGLPRAGTRVGIYVPAEMAGTTTVSGRAEITAPCAKYTGQVEVSVPGAGTRWRRSSPCERYPALMPRMVLLPTGPEIRPSAATQRARKSLRPRTPRRISHRPNRARRPP